MARTVSSPPALRVPAGGTLASSLRVAGTAEGPNPSFLEPSIMNRLERFDVPFVPSQIAQPDGGSIVTLPSAQRLNAEGGGSQAKTVPAGVSGTFASDLSMIIPSAPDLPPLPVVCQHRPSADVMAVTEWSIARALKPPGFRSRPTTAGGHLPGRRTGHQKGYSVVAELFYDCLPLACSCVPLAANSRPASSEA